MSKPAPTIASVDETVSFDRYENGFVVRYDIRDSKGDYVSKKHVVTDRKALIAFIDSLLDLPLSV